MPQITLYIQKFFKDEILPKFKELCLKMNTTPSRMFVLWASRLVELNKGIDPQLNLDSVFNGEYEKERVCYKLVLDEKNIVEGKDGWCDEHEKWILLTECVYCKKKT